MQSRAREKGRFVIDFSRLSKTIKKIVVAVAIDGNLSMRNMQYESFKLFNGEQKIGQFNFEGQEFQQEKALILAEIYEKDAIWRINFIGRGFNGGVGILLKHYGGEEVKEETKKQEPVNAVSQIQKVSLDKEEAVQKLILEKAPHLVDLTKKAVVTLKKKQLIDTVASVALVMDWFGSMAEQYAREKVQRVLDRVLPLALMFDDNKELEIWAFAETFQRLSPIHVKNIRGYIEREAGGWQNWGVGLINNEITVMRDVIATYRQNRVPAYIIFISDGGIHQSNAIKNIIIQAEEYPIFWQFVLALAEGIMVFWRNWIPEKTE